MLFIIIFGTLSFPISPSWARMRMTTKIAKFSQPLVDCLKPCSQQTNWTELNCSSRTAALQQCSQSASWRWRAWPITRRVIGSTWWRSVQFVYCKNGFSVLRVREQRGQPLAEVRSVEPVLSGFLITSFSALFFPLLYIICTLFANQLNIWGLKHLYKYLFFCC